MAGESTLGPLCTGESIARDLRSLGLHSGDVVLLHSSFRSLGWVCGGPEVVVLALLDILGSEGTLVVPTQTEYNSDPVDWYGGAVPPVPSEWHQTIRDSLPAFNPNTTPSKAMGAIAEAVRTWLGAVRSANPQSSFAAIGPLATKLMADHPPECRLGEASPLAKLEQADAKVLLMGTSFLKCTCFHLAEYRTPQPRMQVSFAMMGVGGAREWRTVEDVKLGGKDFNILGGDLEKEGHVANGSIGAAASKLFSLREAVAFAEKWLPVNRPFPGAA